LATRHAVAQQLVERMIALGQDRFLGKGSTGVARQKIETCPASATRVQ
jgi:hypothetical protein